MRIVHLPFWMLATLLMLAGCATGGLVLEDDDDVADDDTGDDDTGDDDTGDDDTADDDTGDDDTSEEPISFAGSTDIIFLFTMYGEPWQFECFADMEAEMDETHTELTGAGVCMLDIPYLGDVPGNLELTAEVIGSNVVGQLIFFDPTGGYLQDLPFEVDGIWDEDQGSVFAPLHASYPDVVDANGEMLLQAL